MDYRTISDAELRSRAREHDGIYNEGGEGYNPYRAEMDRRYRQAARNQPRTRDDVLRDLERVDCSIARESGTWDAEKVAALNAELAQIDAARTAELSIRGWTAEATAARRAEWNTRVEAGQFGTRIIDRAAIEAQEQAQGWTTAELRAAVTHYTR